MDFDEVQGMRTMISFLVVCGLAGALAACGSSNALTTGSLLGGGSSKSAEPPPPKPVTASDRALYVSATVARAQRCGFYFDPDQVRTNYLNAEQQAGTPPETLQKVTKEFDFTRQSVLSAAAGDDGYCTEGRTREVKAALTRQLAGDFNPPQKRQELNVGWFEHQKRETPLDGQRVLDSSQKKAGPRDSY